MAEEKTLEELVVFLPTGVGLTFGNVTILVDDVNLLIFEYRSKRDGSTRKAKFYTKSIAGHGNTVGGPF